MKKTLALILALVMVALMLPVTAITASATGDDPYYFYEDFTKVTPNNGSTGDISEFLPQGWYATPNQYLTPDYKCWPSTINYDHGGTPHSITKDKYEDVITPIGVRIAGEGAGLAMTDKAGLPEDIVKANTDYTLTVTWNTTHKFRTIHFGFSGDNVPSPELGFGVASQVQYEYNGGPSNKNDPGVDGFCLGEGVGGNMAFSGSYCMDMRDEYDTVLDWDDICNLHKPGVVDGHTVTTTFEILEGGKLAAVHNTIDGITVSYMPTSTEFKVSGYLSIWLSGWNKNNTVNIRSVEIKEGKLGGGAKFAEVSNSELLSAVDFSEVKTDAGLEAAGYKFFAVKPADSGDYVPKVDYVEDGIALNANNYDFLINTEVELNNEDTYIIDYTVKMNPAVWIFVSSVGYDVASITSDAADDAAKMADIVAKLSAEYEQSVKNGSSFMMRANIEDKKMACDKWTYFDEDWMQNLGATMPSATALEAACGEANESIRIRMLVSGGTGQYTYMSIGDEHFYLKKDSQINPGGVAGLFGFTFHGQWNEGRGMIIEKAAILKCDMGDSTGGTVITPDKEIDYTDAADTYYKDGYVLHNMDFSKVGNYAETGYSFTTNSSTDRRVAVENGVLSFRNASSRATYLMFTGNAIPKNITEYTANFKFRFVGDINSYFGFICGISIKDNGSRDKSKTVEFAYRDGEVTDCETKDTAAMEAITTGMKNGEWLEVSVSNVGRYVELVTIKCGENTATFTMDPEENGAAVAGYMGFIIGKTTQVELASVTILAGKADKATSAVWPTGVEAGAIVQNVTADAVAEGTKPDYTDLINQILSGEGGSSNNGGEGGDSNNGGEGEGGGENNDSNTNTPAVTTTAATTAAEKKGCGGSIVAVPAIIATAVLGCAVTVCKKKED